jgi:prepilin-type N-terminal cleavage/methylation domain-containing protein
MHRRPRPSPSAVGAARGFTLVELILAILIFSLVIAAVTGVMRTAVRAWRTGHDMDEIVQTGRITKDVVLRDMDNMVYLRQKFYNQSFQGTLFAAAALYQADFQNKGGILELDDRYDLSRITPPIDLSFRISDGGELDKLTFVRSHQSRFAGDPVTWGLRRITYYVQDKTLFRQESDPFGYRPGQLDESFHSATVTAAALAEHFMKPDGYDYLAPGDENVQPLPAEARLLPPSYETAEPLCAGVERFDIVCGYFKEGQWQEVTSWDSSGRRYRQPPQLEAIKDQKLIEEVRRVSPGMLVQADGVTSVVQQPGQPDDLPGYLVVQLGVRGPRGIGRKHTFTFFQALPLAEERDVLQLTKEERAADYEPPIDLNTSRLRVGR